MQEVLLTNSFIILGGFGLFTYISTKVLDTISIPAAA
jgi:hypothetical protein